MAFIQVRDVRKTFGAGESEVCAVNRVSLSFDRGEMVALVGPSGSGKSTLLNIMGLILTPDEGDVLVDGDRPSTWSDTGRCRFRNKTIGYVFQDFALIEDETVRENMLVPLLYNSDISRKSRKERIETVTHRLGVAEKLGVRVSKLSGGQKQRVALARALVCDPPAVFADEPTGQLDAQNRERVVELLSALAHEERRLVVVVTHDMEVAARCDRIVYMHDGRIVSGE